MKMGWVAIVACGVLGFAFGYDFKTYVDTLPTTKVSLYALQNPYSAW